MILVDSRAATLLILVPLFDYERIIIRQMLSLQIYLVVCSLLQRTIYTKRLKIGNLLGVKSQQAVYRPSQLILALFAQPNASHFN